MKPFSLLAALAAASLSLLPGAFAEEGHVLAVKGKHYDLPVGTRITEETTTEIKDAKISITLPNATKEGSSASKGHAVHVREILAPGKIRRITEKEESEGMTKIDGHEEHEPAKSTNPLLGLPVILEEKDGKTTATLEQGRPTPIQEKRLAVLSSSEEAADVDVQRYGEVPRKPGDKWNIDPKLFKTMTGADIPTGQCTMEFLKVGELAGTPCAVLKVVVDVTGMPPPDKVLPKIRYQGEGIIHRSLADRVDLESKIDATVTMEIKPNPQLTILTVGPCSTLSKTTVKKP